MTYTHVTSNKANTKGVARVTKGLHWWWLLAPVKSIWWYKHWRETCAPTIWGYQCWCLKRAYKETHDCNEAMSPTHELAVDAFTVTGQAIFTTDCCEVTCNSYLVSIGTDDFLFVGAFPPLHPVPFGISLVTHFVRLGQCFTPLYEETSLSFCCNYMRAQPSRIVLLAVFVTCHASIFLGHYQMGTFPGGTDDHSGIRIKAWRWNYCSILLENFRSFMSNCFNSSYLKTKNRRQLHQLFQKWGRCTLSLLTFRCTRARWSCLFTDVGNVGQCTFLKREI